MPLCKFKDCGRKVAAWEMCDHHYRRSRRGEPLDEYGNFSPEYIKRRKELGGRNISEGIRSSWAAKTHEEKAKVAASRASKLVSRKMEIFCAVCSKGFLVMPHDLDTRKYCSYACLGRSKAGTKASTPRTTFKCPYCSKEYTVLGLKLSRLDKRFCSPKCRSLWLSGLPYDQWRAKIGEKSKGRSAGTKNPMYGKSPEHGRGVWVESQSQGRIWVKSSWEVNVIGYLNMTGTKWLYEPKRFKLNGLTYVPDFYMPDWGCYWEVKGWFKEKDAVKVSRFRELYPEYPLVVVTEPMYKDFILPLGPYPVSKATELLPKCPKHRPESIEKMKTAKLNWWAAKKAKETVNA